MNSTKMSETVCKFFNRGYCKYLKKCRYFHAKDICEGQCNKTECIKRHPKNCKFGIKCRRNSSCAYKHSTESNENANESVFKEIKEEVNRLKEENKSNIDKITQLEIEIKALKTSLGKVEHPKQPTKKEPVKPCTKKKSKVKESQNTKKNVEIKENKNGDTTDSESTHDDIILVHDCIQVDSSEKGLSVDEVYTKLEPKISKHNLMLVMKFLSEEAHIFSTVDEEHFKTMSEKPLRLPKKL